VVAKVVLPPLVDEVVGSVIAERSAVVGGAGASGTCQTTHDCCQGTVEAVGAEAVSVAAAAADVVVMPKLL